MKSRTTREPRFARWVLSLLSKYEEEFISCGDLGEEFKEVADERGSFIAYLWYWAQVLYAIPSYCKHQLEWSIFMFKNFLKTTFRNIQRNKLFTLINIIGLAIGMACFILIFLWIQDELSFNKFHENKDQLYLLTIKHPTDVIDSNVPYALAPILANEFPEIINCTRIYELSNVSSCSFEYQNKNNHQIMFYENSVILVDESFFSIFSLEFDSHL